MIKFSIIIPVFNSEKSLVELCERLTTTLNKMDGNFEIIMVDDYSMDASWTVIKQIKEKQPDLFKIIKLSKNYGQHNAIFCALKYSKGDYVITIDDDLEQSPEDIPKLYNQLIEHNTEVVYGIGKTQRSVTRKTFSKLWKNATRVIDQGVGNGSSYRVFTSRIKDAINNHPQGVIFIDEIIHWNTHLIEFVPITMQPRKYGATNYTAPTLWKFVNGLFFNYSTLPLRLMAVFGLIISLATFLMGLWFIFKKVFLNVAVDGFTAVIVSVLFSTSVILLAIGILARYINLIFIKLNNKPAYSIIEKDV